MDEGGEVTRPNKRKAGEGAGPKLAYLHAPGTTEMDPQVLATMEGALVKHLPGGLADLAGLGFEVTHVLIDSWGWLWVNDNNLQMLDREQGPFHVRVRDLHPGESLLRTDGVTRQTDLLARAFMYEFRNKANLSTLFNTLSSICGTDNPYARAACIFQSSGWGKSRTVCELWQHEVWVVYLSFASGTGYPIASSIKGWFLQQAEECLKKPFILGQLECMTFSLAYFAACLSELNSLIRQKGFTQQAFSTMLSTGLNGAKEFWDNVQQKMGHFLHKYKDLPIDAARYEEPSDAWAKWAVDASPLFGDAIADFKQDHRSFSVLFVYDEARHLLKRDTGNPNLNSLIPISRSAQAMAANGGGMLLFIDTSAQVINFADKVWADPSISVAKGGLKFAPPIWAPFSADVSQEDWQLFFPSTRTFQEIVRPAWYVRYGRPLWWAQFRSNTEVSLSDAQTKQDDARTERVLRLVHIFARDKILGGGGSWDYYFAHGKENAKLSTEAALSLLGVRVAFDVDPRCRLASTMVANNLLTVISISPSKEHVWTAWNVEPLVAQVAADVVNTLHRHGRSAELYSKLVEALVAGWIDKGYEGELTARIILLHAVDKAMGDRTYCSMDDFCKSLVKHKESLSFLNGKLPDRLSAARLHFNAFRRIYKNSDELIFKDFREAFERGYAIICGQGALPLGLYIVAFCGNDDEELVEQNMALILVQVKSREIDSSKVSYANISPQSTGFKVMKNLQCLTLYMDVMDKKNASCKVVSLHQSENAAGSSNTGLLIGALARLKRQASAPEVHVSEKPQQSNNEDALDNCLTAQNVLAVKGLDAFDLEDDLKKMLKSVVQASKEVFIEGEASCRELLRLQREYLPNMFPHLNIGDFK